MKNAKQHAQTVRKVASAALTAILTAGLLPPGLPLGSPAMALSQTVEDPQVDNARQVEIVTIVDQEAYDEEKLYEGDFNLEHRFFADLPGKAWDGHDTREITEYFDYRQYAPADNIISHVWGNVIPGHSWISNAEFLGDEGPRVQPGDFAFQLVPHDGEGGYGGLLEFYDFVKNGGLAGGGSWGSTSITTFFPTGQTVVVHHPAVTHQEARVAPALSRAAGGKVTVSQSPVPAWDEEVVTWRREPYTYRNVLCYYATNLKTGEELPIWDYAERVNYGHSLERRDWDVADGEKRFDDYHPGWSESTTVHHPATTAYGWGWGELDGKDYYVRRGETSVLTGWQLLDEDGLWHEFAADGAATGRTSVEDPRSAGLDDELARKYPLDKDYWVYEGDEGDVAVWRVYRAGKMRRNTWVSIGQDWYWLGDDGKMQVGWFLDPSDGHWYFMNDRHDGTYGKLCSGWLYRNGRWYWLNPVHDGTFGRMMTGWQLIRGTWYWFYDDGHMITGYASHALLYPNARPPYAQDYFDASGAWKGTVYRP